MISSAFSFFGFNFFQEQHYAFATVSMGVKLFLKSFMEM